MSDDWVDKLKVGDWVVVKPSHMALPRLECVTKATKTQITAGHQVFRRKTHKLQGAGVWSWTRIEEATPEIINQIKERDDAIRLSALLTNYIGTASYDQLKRLWAATDEV